MGKIKNFYRRFWQHFSKLRFLKDFSVNLYNKLDSEVLNFLRKLDSLKDELGSLKKFSLFLSHLDVDSDVNLDFVNIYKHLTGFRIHESSFATTQKFLNNLESFKRLESLNVLKNMSHPGEENEIVNFSYFSKLEYLDRIENMDIAFNFGESLLNFLEYFAIPKSIISLKLSFYETNWTRILVSSDELENMKTLNAFESHPVCVNFYEKWRNLQKLECLALCFCERTSSMTPSLYFATPIIKNLTSLKEFYFGNWVNNFSAFPNTPEKIKALNLNYVWEALKHLKPSLKRLYIDSSAISLRKFPVEFKEEEKLSLEEFGLCGLVLGDLCIENFSKIFSKNLTDHASRLEIESIIVDNKKSMQKLMDLLMNLSKRVQVSVSIDLRNINSGDFIEVATEALQKIMKKRSHLKMDFNRIPELSQMELKNFKKLFKEYKASIINLSNESLLGKKQRNLRGISLSPQEMFEGFEGSEGSEEGERDLLNFFEDEEEEFEEEELEFEDDSSEIMDEEELLEDDLEEIDEDI